MPAEGPFVEEVAAALCIGAAPVFARFEVCCGVAGRAFGEDVGEDTGIRVLPFFEDVGEDTGIEFACGTCRISRFFIFSCLETQSATRASTFACMLSYIAVVSAECALALRLASDFNVKSSVLSFDLIEL